MLQPGEAIAAYLWHGRPATALDRSVFIRITAPHRGLTSAGVTKAVAAAARRAGAARARAPMAGEPVMTGLPEALAGLP